MTQPLNGLVLGRFQPFHLGHLEYIAAAKQRCSRLFVGITNPDPDARRRHDADEWRSRAESNPFTYAERRAMIEECLWDQGWTDRVFCLIPAPLLVPERLMHYLPPPSSTVAYITVYDAWGDEKVRQMQQLGYKTEVLWRRDPSTRIASGTQVRAALRAAQPWHHLVPPAIAGSIEKRSTHAS